MGEPVSTAVLASAAASAAPAAAGTAAVATPEAMMGMLGSGFALEGLPAVGAATGAGAATEAAGMSLLEKVALGAGIGSAAQGMLGGKKEPLQPEKFQPNTAGYQPTAPNFIQQKRPTRFRSLMGR